MTLRQGNLLPSVRFAAIADPYQTTNGKDRTLRKGDRIGRPTVSAPPPEETGQPSSDCEAHVIATPGTERPIEIAFAPQGNLPGLPVEVLHRSSLVARLAAREIATRQRVGFHQLLLCVAGSGTHVVDFDPIPFRPGTLCRIHPGQVQRFLPEDDFEALMVVWPVESHHADPDAPAWYPGSDVPTRWDLNNDMHEQVCLWIESLADAQASFQNTSAHRSLMQSLLCTLLMRLSIDIPSASPVGSRLPRAYLDFRQIIEQSLNERPTVMALAQDLGYSTRTLDRACQQASGRTARDILDDRVALEVRRLLTHTDRPFARISAELGFTDPSNFSKFVKRNLGQVPTAIREQR